MNSYVVNLYPIPNEFGLGEALNVTNAAVQQFTTSFDPKTSCVYVTCSGGDFYVTFDGTTPSATNGHYINSVYYAWWSKEAARVAKMIGSSGTTAHIRISQFTY